MELNIYHKILKSLFEYSGGKTSNAIDLKDLVKKHGFLGSYQDIFRLLSVNSWIVETSKADYVCITHWGIKEVKKTQDISPDTSKNLSNQTGKLIENIKEFLNTTEEFAAETSIENLNQITKKFEEIKLLIDKIAVSI